MSENNNQKLPINLSKNNESEANSSKSNSAPQTKKKRKKYPNNFTLFIIAIIIIIIYKQPNLVQALTNKTDNSEYEEHLPYSDNVKDISNNEFVAGLGSIAPLTDIIKLEAPYGAADAKIEKIYVTTEQEVKKGQLLAILDNNQGLQAKLTLAEKNLEYYESILQKEIKAINAKVKIAEFKVEKAREKLNKDRKDYERTKDLHSQKVVSNEALSQAKLDLSNSEAEFGELEAQLAQYSYENNDINTQADVVAAKMRVELSKAEVRVAELALQQSEIRAPIYGKIINIYGNEGERVKLGGLITIANLSRMKVEAEIYQNLIKDVKKGANVIIESDSLPNNLKGVVEKIGIEVKKQGKISVNPAAEADRRVLEVDILLDEESSNIAAKYINMQVLAKIYK